MSSYLYMKVCTGDFMAVSLSFRLPGIKPIPVANMLCSQRNYNPYHRVVVTKRLEPGGGSRSPGKTVASSASVSPDPSSPVGLTASRTFSGASFRDRGDSAGVNGSQSVI